jgi:hypothetical protein
MSLCWYSEAAAESRVSLRVPPNNPIDLQSLKLIDFHLLRWSAQQHLVCVLGALSRNAKDPTQVFSNVAEAVANLPARTLLLDGETNLPTRRYVLG